MRNDHGITLIQIVSLLLLGLFGWLTGGCSESGLSPRPINLPSSEQEMVTTIRAEKPAIEIGDTVVVSASVQDLDSQFISGIRLILFVDPNDAASGYISQDTVVTDTISPTGIVPGATFFSTNTGDARLIAIRLSEFDIPLDSATFDLQIAETVYRLEVLLDQRIMNRNFQYRIGAKMTYTWTNGDIEEISGRHIYFRSYDRDNPENPFGIILPASEGITVSDSLYGIEDILYIHSVQPGAGVLEAFYFNILGNRVLSDTIHFNVLSNG